ncbi:hypothetical protein [Staphylococcus caeli]|uniref:Uncharacterized protein n=1 Tax=Staphylococcus caeli TaxID=2201815 RepID=A0A1D4KW29_9STAP|nr:hypothetical protein [Staphylococcus caeli]AWM30166.1 hypothetical protein SCC82B_00026 [Staphylococcus caeli]SCS78218.1 Uncharacterised protein [Staphylococcus caeli]SCS97894.1 Uncharacterised protein [Staphylococcus caeli]
MDKSKLYVFIVVGICLIAMAICLPFLIKNGSYSAIFSASIPIVVLVFYFIFNKRHDNNDNNKD